jgi:hypothetical protein
MHSSGVRVMDCKSVGVDEVDDGNHQLVVLAVNTCEWAAVNVVEAQQQGQGYG